MKTFSQFFTEATLQKGEHYGSPGYQKRLEDERSEQRNTSQEIRNSDTNQAAANLKSGFMVGSQGGKMGKFYKDAVTGKYTVFRPD